MRVSVLAGRGINRHYEYGILRGLVENGLLVDFIGPDTDQLGTLAHEVAVFNFFEGYESQTSIAGKLLKTLQFYIKLFFYTLRCQSRIFHLQWLNKFEYFDRTLLNLFYRLAGKKLVLTAHNIDPGERDGKSTWLNRATLKFMYRCMNHIIVHTERSKGELISKFNVPEEKVTVIPHGIMDMVPKYGISRNESRKRLNIPEDRKVLLFFGNITRYKGLDILIDAMGSMHEDSSDYHLVIAGMVKSPKEQDQGHYREVLAKIEKYQLKKSLTEFIHFIPDEMIEPLFMAADALVLPYRHIFQSGVPFLSYYFGLPVIASDAGSFEEEITAGKTGYVFRSGDPEDLVEKIRLYFNSNLFHDIEETRQDIVRFAEDEFSWIKIGTNTKKVYLQLLKGNQTA